MRFLIVVVTLLAVISFVSAVPDDDDKIKDVIKKTNQPDKLLKNLPPGEMTPGSHESMPNKPHHHLPHIHGNEMKEKFSKARKQKRSPQVADYFNMIKDKVLGRKKRGADQIHEPSPTSDSLIEFTDKINGNGRTSITY